MVVQDSCDLWQAALGKGEKSLLSILSGNILGNPLFEVALSHSVSQLVDVEVLLLEGELPCEELLAVKLVTGQLGHNIPVLADDWGWWLHFVWVQFVTAQLRLGSKSLIDVSVMVFVVVGEELLDTSALVLGSKVSLRGVETDSSIVGRHRNEVSIWREVGIILVVHAELVNGVDAILDNFLDNEPLSDIVDHVESVVVADQKDVIIEGMSFHDGRKACDALGVVACSVQVLDDGARVRVVYFDLDQGLAVVLFLIV